MRTSIVVFLLAAASVAGAVPVADREARVDESGVMRWADDGSEVAVFGVNYYTPFALDYRVLGERGHDRKRTIRRDVAHFRRLGLTALRLHCFDREFSTREGAFVDNEHVELLDYLIATAASNGIYTVLTPIAAWGGGKWTSCTNGFAYPVGMRELTSRPELLAPQVRFEEEFARHRNRYTGRRYADDPAVLCFELVNEPNYPKGRTGEQVAAYANALLAGIRRSGTTKPVFYSATWNGHNDCVPELKTDGVSGVYYATGLEAGYAYSDILLGRVLKSSLAADPRLAGKAKIVYEFDAADMTGAYMYPAMARLFRSEGAQSATQFQYDSVDLAEDNVSYRTHFLNLVYTPAKAISLAIAAEAFRLLPRGTDFSPAAERMAFAPFAIDATRNLAELVTDRKFYHTASTRTQALDPARLEHVWGCGTSSVVRASGNGCYFFDRVSPGLWRLQVYPSVRPCADPFTGKEGKKVVVLGRPAEFTVALPDLGKGFSAWRRSDAKPAGVARNGRIALAPGDYVLSRRADPTAEDLRRVRSADIAPWYAPEADPADEARPVWPVSLACRAAEKKARFPRPESWNFFDADLAVQASGNGGWTERTTDDKGRPACRYRAKDFLEKEAMSASVPTDGNVYAAAFPNAPTGSTIVVTCRAAENRPERLELAFRLADGQVWGTVLTLPAQWEDVRLPLAEFTYFSHWDVPAQRPEFKLDMTRANRVGLCFGKWLDPAAAGRAHALDISSIRLER